MSPKPIAFRRRHRVSRLSAAVLAAFSIALLVSSPGLAAAGADSSLSAGPSGKSSRRWPYKTGAAEPVRDEVHTRSVSSKPVHQRTVWLSNRGKVRYPPSPATGQERPSGEDHPARYSASLRRATRYRLRHHIASPSASHLPVTSAPQSMCPE